MASKEAPQTFWWGRGNQENDPKRKHPKWSFGVLNDKYTLEVPGSVLLLSGDRNEPLGMRNVPSRVSHSTLPVDLPFDVPPTPGEISQPGNDRPRSPVQRGRQPEKKTKDEVKRTADGAIILDPQPDDSANDPLNWPSWRRDAALLSLGFYCMLGGGMTPAIAAGFTNVAKDFKVSVETVALTTGLYMMGLGLGSVFASPTAILFGKRPVYLASAVMFIGASLWCGFSPSFPSLLAARIIQGMAISPVECLPSATIAEIFFLHERAYRIGIYTLLLLGGKNLVPLVSATIIGQFGWRWVFFIVAIIVGFAGLLLFLFVPETFWDRTPVKRTSRSLSLLRRLSRSDDRRGQQQSADPVVFPARDRDRQPPSPGLAQRQRELHIGFAPRRESADVDSAKPSVSLREMAEPQAKDSLDGSQRSPMDLSISSEHDTIRGTLAQEAPAAGQGQDDKTTTKEKEELDESGKVHIATGSSETVRHLPMLLPPPHPHADLERSTRYSSIDLGQSYSYTHRLRHRPAQTFVQQLKPFHGRLNKDNWFKVMARPFILFAYPAVLWSAIVYACSIGWLIVMSETLAIIYRDPATYNFTALQTGLVYISPFIGGILGTGVAGKVSDIIVRAMARRNGGLYEPEYRLVMAIPILIATSAGLIGFGWAVEEKDAWIVPTIFFGLVSFGCSLGSTTSITFCVDSYRQYAGEALVTLNFSKNIFHGLVFSLFFSKWMARDGPKTVYIWLGVIQAAACIMSIPMYIFGKRARMWTVRMNLMEKL